MSSGVEVDRSVPRLRERVRIAPFDGPAGSASYIVEAKSGRWRAGRMMAAVLMAIDGERSEEAIAQEVARQLARPVSVAQVRRLVQWAGEKGLLAGCEPAQQAPSTVEDQVVGRIPLLSPAMMTQLGRVGAWLFHWPAAIGLVLLMLLARLWVYPQAIASNGVPFYGSVDWGVLLLGGLALGLFHELGHGSAIVRFGRRPGTAGIGFYLIYPVYYCDVSEAWGLTRWQRAVVDLGGAYFQTTVATVLLLLYTQFPSPELYWIAVLSDWSILMTLNPFLKMDGYWLVSDLMGLANLRRLSFQAVGSLLWPSRWQPPRLGESVRFLRVYGLVTIAFFLVGGGVVLYTLITQGLDQYLAVIRWGAMELQGGRWKVIPELFVGLTPAIGLVVGLGKMLQSLVRRLARSIW